MRICDADRRAGVAGLNVLDGDAEDDGRRMDPAPPRWPHRRSTASAISYSPR